MKIVHVNNADIKGGASRACYNISKALKSGGVNSSILTQTKFGNDSNVFSVSEGKNNIKSFLRKGIDWALIQGLTIKEKGRFSFPLIGADISKHEVIKDADIIHLHWINEGFFSLKTLQKLGQLNKPIVWTMHDMWGFTGGCHYNNGCENFLHRCGNCPSLKFPAMHDGSFSIFARKLLVYKYLNLHLVTCSKWLGEESKRSVLMHEFPVTPIPNPINTELYKPLDKLEAKSSLNLDVNKIHILFVSMTATERRKGFIELKKSLKFLANKYDNVSEKIELVIMGSASDEIIQEIPIRSKILGRISSDKDIVNIYNAADIFVAPSLQDNLPNTVMEATACGTPVVAFNIGGIPDMIEHNKNGILADAFSTEDLAEAIIKLVNDINLRQCMSDYGREKVLKEFTPKVVSAKYKNLYEKILKPI